MRAQRQLRWDAAKLPGCFWWRLDPIICFCLSRCHRLHTSWIRFLIFSVVRDQWYQSGSEVPEPFHPVHVRHCGVWTRQTANSSKKQIAAASAILTPWTSASISIRLKKSAASEAKQSPPTKQSATWWLYGDGRQKSSTTTHESREVRP